MDEQVYAQASTPLDIKTLFEALTKPHDQFEPLDSRPLNCCAIHDGFQALFVRIPTYIGPAIQLADGRIFKGCVQLQGDPITEDGTDGDMEALFVSLCKDLCEDHFLNEISSPQACAETPKGFKEVCVFFRDTYEGPGIQLDDGRLFKGGIDISNLGITRRESSGNTIATPNLRPTLTHSISAVTTHSTSRLRRGSPSLRLPTQPQVPQMYSQHIELARKKFLDKYSTYTTMTPVHNEINPNIITDCSPPSSLSSCLAKLPPAGFLAGGVELNKIDTPSSVSDSTNPPIRETKLPHDVYSPNLPVIYCRTVGSNEKIFYKECLVNEGSYRKTDSIHGLDSIIPQTAEVFPLSKLPLLPCTPQLDAYYARSLSSSHEHDQHHRTKSRKPLSMSALDDHMAQLSLSPRSSLWLPCMEFTSGSIMFDHVPFTSQPRDRIAQRDLSSLGQASDDVLHPLSIDHTPKVDAPRCEQVRTVPRKRNRHLTELEQDEEIASLERLLTKHNNPHEHTRDGLRSPRASLSRSEVHDQMAQTAEILQSQQLPLGAVLKHPRTRHTSTIDTWEKLIMGHTGSLGTPPTTSEVNYQMAQSSEKLSQQLSADDSSKFPSTFEVNACMARLEAKHSSSPLPPCSPRKISRTYYAGNDIAHRDQHTTTTADSTTTTSLANKKSEQSPSSPNQCMRQLEPICVAPIVPNGWSSSAAGATGSATSKPVWKQVSQSPEYLERQLKEEVASSAEMDSLGAPFHSIKFAYEKPTLATLLTPYKLLRPATTTSHSWATTIENHHAFLMASRTSEDAFNAHNWSFTPSNAAQLSAMREAEDQCRWATVLPSWFFDTAAYDALEREMEKALHTAGVGEVGCEVVDKFLGNERKIREEMQGFVKELQRKERASY